MFVLQIYSTTVKQCHIHFLAWTSVICLSACHLISASISSLLTNTQNLSNHLVLSHRPLEISTEFGLEFGELEQTT